MTEPTTSLYRRHRPGSFDEVVGQGHVVRTLRNAVQQDRVHHAYLFVGSRGTGKTSMAKILARSLNCVNAPTVEPCGTCESCRSIASGSSIDVIEMDAASNRSVDDVRDLRERVAFAPAAGRWKVYILDEAHMLTKEAWNAFLKTLEEPPPNTVFVLATTEAHKVMATIVDRCQRFDFGRPSLEEIAEVLNRVADAEGVEIEKAAVGMIARSARGSFRDALGTLDQLIAFGGNQVSLNSVLDVLGAADAELLFEAVDALGAENGGAALMAVEKMARSGRDPVQFARDLLAHLRHLLVTQATGQVPDSFVVTASDPDRLRAQAAATGPATLIRAIDELSAALTAVREGDEARMAVEIALMKAARPDLDPSREALLRRIEKLEQQLGKAAPSPAPPARAAQAASSALPAKPGSTDEPAGAEDPGSDAPNATATVAPQAPDEPTAETAGDEAAGAEPTGNAAGAEPTAGGAEPTGEEAGAEPIDLERLLRVWPAVLDQLRQSGSAMLGALFDGARPVAVDNTEHELQIGFPTSATFNKRKAETADTRERVAEALRTIVGERLRPVFVLLDGESSEGDVPEPEQSLDEEDLFERLKSEFDGEEVADG